MDLFKRWYGSDDLKDAMSPNTDYDDLRKVVPFLFVKAEAVLFGETFYSLPY